MVGSHDAVYTTNVHKNSRCNPLGFHNENGRIVRDESGSFFHYLGVSFWRVPRWSNQVVGASHLLLDFLKVYRLVRVFTHDEPVPLVVRVVNIAVAGSLGGWLECIVDNNDDDGVAIAGTDFYLDWIDVNAVGGG